MKNIKFLLKGIYFISIIILLSGCNGEFNLNRKNNKYKESDKNEKNKTQNKLEIKISCDEVSIEEYLKDGWKINKQKSKEKICSWKSIPANNYCNIEKDKGCKIITPDKMGTETIYILEK